jgi:hypothetical protein
LKNNRCAEEIIKPFLNGRDVRRYYLDHKHLYLIYTYRGVDISRYPAIEQHLKPFKSRLQARSTKQAWYELQQAQYNFAKYMDGPKIIFPDIAIAPRFTLDEIGYYSSNTTYFLPHTDRYLLGLLNSKLGKFYFVKTCAGLEGASETYLRFFGQYLENFPVRVINCKNYQDRITHDEMEQLVDSMLGTHKQLIEAKLKTQRELLQLRIEETDREIDRMVYELYELTDEEIKIVEGER